VVGNQSIGDVVWFTYRTRANVLAFGGFVCAAEGRYGINVGAVRYSELLRASLAVPILLHISDQPFVNEMGFPILIGAMNKYAFYPFVLPFDEHP